MSAAMTLFAKFSKDVPINDDSQDENEQWNTHLGACILIDACIFAADKITGEVTRSEVAKLKYEPTVFILGMAETRERFDESGAPKSTLYEAFTLASESLNGSTREGEFHEMIVKLVGTYSAETPTLREEILRMIAERATPSDSEGEDDPELIDSFSIEVKEIKDDIGDRDDFLSWTSGFADESVTGTVRGVELCLFKEDWESLSAIKECSFDHVKQYLTRPGIYKDKIKSVETIASRAINHWGILLLIRQVHATSLETGDSTQYDAVIAEVLRIMKSEDSCGLSLAGIDPQSMFKSGGGLLQATHFGGGSIEDLIQKGRGYVEATISGDDVVHHKFGFSKAFARDKNINQVLAGLSPWTYTNLTSALARTMVTFPRLEAMLRDGSELLKSRFRWGPAGHKALALILWIHEEFSSEIVQMAIHICPQSTLRAYERNVVKYFPLIRAVFGTMSFFDWFSGNLMATTKDKSQALYAYITRILAIVLLLARPEQVADYYGKPSTCAAIENIVSRVTPEFNELTILSTEWCDHMISHDTILDLKNEGSASLVIGAMSNSGSSHERDLAKELHGDKRADFSDRMQAAKQLDQGSIQDTKDYHLPYSVFFKNLVRYAGSSSMLAMAKDVVLSEQANMFLNTPNGLGDRLSQHSAALNEYTFEKPLNPKCPDNTFITYELLDSHSRKGFDAVLDLAREQWAD